MMMMKSRICTNAESAQKTNLSLNCSTPSTIYGASSSYFYDSRLYPPHPPNLADDSLPISRHLLVQF